MKLRRSELWLFLAPVAVAAAFLSVKGGHYLITSALEWNYYGQTKPRLVQKPLQEPSNPKASFGPVEWSPDSRRLAAGEMHRHHKTLAIDVWETDTGRLISRTPEPIFSRHLVFNPDGRSLIVCNREGCYDRDVQNGRNLGPKLGMDSKIHQYDSEAPASWTYSLSGNPVWKLDSRPTAPFVLQGRKVESIVKTPAGETDKLYLNKFYIDVKTRELKPKTHSFQIETMYSSRVDSMRLETPCEVTVTASDDRRYIYVSSRFYEVFGPSESPVNQGTKSTTAVFEVASGRRLWHSPTPKRASRSACVFSPDNSLLAIFWFVHPSRDSFMGMLTVMSVANGNTVMTSTMPTPQINSAIKSMAFSPDGNSLAIAHADRLAIWDVSNLTRSNSPQIMPQE